MAVSFDHLRHEYERATLFEEDLDQDPFVQFRAWFDDAENEGLPLPDAATLATTDEDGAPNARIVLLRGIDGAFTFFTSYESQKAFELDANPRATLLVYWVELQRQVRIRGVVAKVSREESEAYFATRPRGGQIGAWASQQSAPLSGRAELDANAAAIEARFAGRDVPTPPRWGGYRLTPDAIEFWQGRPSRLHDRLRYARQQDGSWRIERLSP